MGGDRLVAPLLFQDSCRVGYVKSRTTGVSSFHCCFKVPASVRQLPLGFAQELLPMVGVDPSRLAALLVLSIRGVCAILAPYQTGVSAPKHLK